MDFLPASGCTSPSPVERVRACSISCHALERSAADDRSWESGTNDPIALRYRSHLWIYSDFCAPLYRLPYTSDPAGYGLLSCGSTAMVVVRCAVTVRIAHRLLVPRRVRHAVPVQNGRDALCAMPRQITRDAPHHGGRPLHDRLFYPPGLSGRRVKGTGIRCIVPPGACDVNSTDIFR